MHTCLAMGLVIDLGPALLHAGWSSSGDPDRPKGGDKERIEEVLNAISRNIGGFLKEGVIRVPLSSTWKALRALPLCMPLIAAAAGGTSARSPFAKVGFFIGPSIEWRFVYVTIGICVGGFGAFGIGGGIRFRRWGIAGLVPFLRMW